MCLNEETSTCTEYSVVKGGGTGLSRSNNLVELDHSCGVGWGVQCAPWFKVR